MPRYQPAEPVLRSATTHSTVVLAATVGYAACVSNEALYALSGGSSNGAGASFDGAAVFCPGSWNAGISMFGIWSCGMFIDSTTDRVQLISSIIACCSDGVAATRATKVTATVRNAQRPG